MLKRANADAGKAARAVLKLDGKKRKAPYDEDEQDESESEADEQPDTKEQNVNRGRGRPKKAPVAPKARSSKRSKATASEDTQESNGYQSASNFANPTDAEQNPGLENQQGLPHGGHMTSMDDLPRFGLPVHSHVPGHTSYSGTRNPARFRGMGSIHPLASQNDNIDAFTGYSYAQTGSRNMVQAQPNDMLRPNFIPLPVLAQESIQDQSAGPEQLYSHMDGQPNTRFAVSDLGTFPGNEIGDMFHRGDRARVLNSTSMGGPDLLADPTLDYLPPQSSESQTHHQRQLQYQDYLRHEELLTAPRNRSRPDSSMQTTSDSMEHQVQQNPRPSHAQYNARDGTTFQSGEFANNPSS